MNRNRTTTWLLGVALLHGPQLLAAGSPPDIEVRLVPATAAHTQNQLPAGDSYFSTRYSATQDRYLLRHELSLPFDFFVEIWISDVGELNTGVTSAYFDVAWSDGVITDAVAITHGTLFGLFQEGAIDNSGDRIVNFGGSDATFSGQGREPTFARVGWIELSHAAPGSVDFDATVGLGEVGVRNRTVGAIRIIGAGVRLCLNGSDCDDGNPCTLDSCDDSIGCVHLADDSAECDDGIFCNGADSCGGGTCSVHSDNACPPNTVCDELTDACGPIRQLLDCDPNHCNVDARMPNDPQDADIFLTNDTFAFHYNAPVVELIAASYEVSMLPVGGTLPVVLIVTAAGNDATVVLDRPIRPNRYTCIRDIAIDQRCCFGVLPGDADDSLISQPTDLFEIIDNLAGSVAPPLPPEKCDIDRSNRCTGADLLMEVDVLNGAGALQPYNGSSLPDCPSSVVP